MRASAGPPGRLVTRELGWVTVGLRDADDERRYDWWRFAEHVALELGDFEAGGGDRLDCWSVAVAAVAEPRLKSVQPVLPSGEALVVGAYVLDEQQAAAGPEHPVEFAKRSWLVVDRAEH